MPRESIETFRLRSPGAGADGALERRWPPKQVVETHTHPFDAEALERPLAALS